MAIEDPGGIGAGKAFDYHSAYELIYGLLLAADATSAIAPIDPVALASTTVSLRTGRKRATTDPALAQPIGEQVPSFAGTLAAALRRLQEGDDAVMFVALDDRWP